MDFLHWTYKEVQNESFLVDNLVDNAIPDVFDGTSSWCRTFLPYILEDFRAILHAALLKEASRTKIRFTNKSINLLQSSLDCSHFELQFYFCDDKLDVKDIQNLVGTANLLIRREFSNFSHRLCH